MTNTWEGVVVPWPAGADYGGATIVEIIEFDDTDSYQPWLYLLSNGETVWIPVDKKPA